MQRTAGPSNDQCRILIVEDDPLISSHLEAIVSQTIDAPDVVVSASVAEAIDALRSTVDFALLDVDVLDGTTYALASRLSSESIPFAFLSASKRELIPAALKDAPFVAKPYTDDDIVELIHAAGRGLDASD